MITKEELTRPIVGIENRTAHEVFSIMCDRFTAAFSDLPAGMVKVKQLEWKEDGCGNLFAETPFGDEFIQKWILGGSNKMRFEYEGRNYATAEYAKDAAQDDYSARIMGAIEPAGIGTEYANRSTGGFTPTANAAFASMPGPAVKVHSDDIAVDSFAAAMKAKLAQKRAEGSGGWDNPYACSIKWLSKLLRSHVEKADPVDVGNFAMMIHQRGGRICK